jgi:hypothetical protein
MKGNYKSQIKTELKKPLHRLVTNDQAKQRIQQEMQTNN